MYIGNEPLLVSGHELSVTVNDFWRWAFSDLSVPAAREAFAEFLVASSLELISDGQGRTNQRSVPLWNLSDGDGNGIRVGVRSAACLQSDSAEHPDRIIFDIPPERTCDVRVFCVFKAMTRNESPLNTDLWDFYSVRERDISINITNPTKFPLSALTRLEPVWSDYYGIPGAVLAALSKG